MAELVTQAQVLAVRAPTDDEPCGTEEVGEDAWVLDLATPEGIALTAAFDVAGFDPSGLEQGATLDVVAVVESVVRKKEYGWRRELSLWRDGEMWVGVAMNRALGFEIAPGPLRCWMSVDDHDCTVWRRDLRVRDGEGWRTLRAGQTARVGAFDLTHGWLETDRSGGCHTPDDPEFRIGAARPR